MARHVPRQLGLGDAIARFMRLHHIVRTVPNVESAAPGIYEEHELLREALNAAHVLDFGFDCDADGVADDAETLDVFAESARTGCCRILDLPHVESVAKKPTGRLL